MAAQAYIGLGSNLGDRRQMICRALTGIAALPGTAVTAVSSLWETAPWGVVDQPMFLNCVAAVQTDLSPTELLQRLLSLENELGRVRTMRWGPRLVDLDLLLYDALTLDTAFLTLPHPRITERLFVLVPLAELNENIEISGKRVSDHLAAKADQRKPDDVKRWGMPPAFIDGRFV